MTLSTGIEPASPGRQPGRIARRVRELGTGEPLVPPPAPPWEIARPTCGRPGLKGMRQPKASTPSGIRTRVAGLRGRHPRSARRPGREPRNGDTFDARASAAGGAFAGREANCAASMRSHQEGPVGEPGVPPPDCDGWARTSILRVTAGRPTLWTTSHREAEAAGLEPASGARRLRASNALPCQLGHASGRASRRAPCGDARRAASARKAEGEGVEPPSP